MKHELCVAEQFDTSILSGIRAKTAAYSYVWYYSFLDFAESITGR
jgi:hypothetical protein